MTQTIENIRFGFLRGSVRRIDRLSLSGLVVFALVWAWLGFWIVKLFIVNQGA